MLGLAAALLTAAPAAGQIAPADLPFEVRVRGSFPLQYSEIVRGASQQAGFSAAPYLSLMAVRELQPSLTTTAFVEAGHAPLGQFRDNDNTFTSFGGNIVKRWDNFSIGTSLEHTQFYSGAFDAATSTANDVNIFARYYWLPNEDLQIRPIASAAVRFDDTLAAQRYTISGVIDIERRLIGSWWLIAVPRLRYSEYTGAEAGRRDLTASIVAGLKYAFNESVSAKMLAGYESRMSNLPNRDRERLIVGVSLDYEFAFGRLR